MPQKIARLLEQTLDEEEFAWKHRHRSNRSRRSFRIALTARSRRTKQRSCSPSARSSWKLAPRSRRILGDVGPVMGLRAESKVQMKITGGFTFPEFAKALVGDAVRSAARGILESDWMGGVFSGPNAPVEAWMRDAYERTIAFLRKQKPWPWAPEEESEWVGHFAFLRPLA